MQLDNSDIIGCVTRLGLQPAGVGTVASVQCTNTFFDQAGTMLAPRAILNGFVVALAIAVFTWVLERVAEAF